MRIEFEAESMVKINGVLYKVTTTVTSTCKGCSFLAADLTCLTSGFICSSVMRTDCLNVIFKQV